MQDEVAKHTKKIYTVMKSPGHTFIEKLKEVAIEIFIIVFAVTLSIWLHSWSDHRHEQEEVSEFLNGLKGDLANDIHILQDDSSEITKVDSNFRFLRTIYNDKRLDTAGDRLIAHYLYYALRATHSNVGRYEGFKSSGKLGAIENDSLKQHILVYYQQTIPGLQDQEGLVNDLQSKIMELQIGRSNQTSLRNISKTIRMQSLLEFSIGNMNANLQTYHQAIQQAQKIISMIDHPTKH